MLLGRTMAAMVLMASVASLAAPPAPVQMLPADGDWMRRNGELRAGFTSSAPAEVLQFEFEVHAPEGVRVYGDTHGRGSLESGRYVDDAVTGVPDASMYSWRARTLGDGGVLSAWTGFWTFRIDDQPTTTPTAVTVVHDGGTVWVTSETVTDTQSGVASYHLNIGQLDEPDGSFVSQGDGRFTSTTPSWTVLVGPGTWHFGVHGHDRVSNSGANRPSNPIVVPADLALAPPGPPALVLSDGGPNPTGLFVNTTSPRVGMTSPTPNATGFVVIASRPDSGVWRHAGHSSSGSFTLGGMEDGPWDMRAAALVDEVVTDWSASEPVWVDDNVPNWFSVTSRRDGGDVLVSWARASDYSAVGSGVERYEVYRTDDGSPEVHLATVPETLDAGYSWQDFLSPGRYTYRIRAIDRAANGRNVSTTFAVVSNTPGEYIQIAPALRQALRCGDAFELPLSTTGDAPTSWRLDQGPARLQLVNSSLSWAVTAADVGRHDVVVRVNAVRGFDVATLPLEVTCAPEHLQVGCTAAPTGAFSAALSLAWVWLLRRRRRA